MGIFLHEKYQKDNETIKIKSKKIFSNIYVLNKWENIHHI
ncbi:hypothetical protein HMPREF3199_01054 [Enterococcus faecium]|nr:hypothetical protein HMPREF3199_01054 [Enterococcus faecium]